MVVMVTDEHMEAEIAKLHDELNDNHQRDTQDRVDKEVAKVTKLLCPLLFKIGSSFTFWILIPISQQKGKERQLQMIYLI